MDPAGGDRPGGGGSPPGARSPDGSIATGDGGTGGGDVIEPLAPGCGDGVLTGDELCDPPGSCPLSCDDGDACTADALSGSAATCDASCTRTPITTCAPGDGCCAPGCTNADDADCPAVCGNGVVESGETCDGDGDAACPSSCDDADACTTDAMMGAAATCTAECAHTTISACVSGDGCCAAGCTVTNDADCRVDCTNPGSWPTEWSRFEERVLELVNAIRMRGASCGSDTKPPVGPLVMDAALRRAARCHSMDMAENDFMSHTGSDGSSPWDRIARAGYTASARAENVAAGYSTPEQVVDGWMSSYGHCVNIMSGGSNEIGVGYATQSGTRFFHYWTQAFGQR